MARLNEPAAPVESIESLKRKFMRQNRDLARANSTQSLRIRNLENEISKILADNLGLREQILHLQNELDNGKSKKIADHAGAIRSQLETKLLEIGALITGLGDEAPPKKHSPRSSRLMRTSPKRSPDQRNWKNICSLSEAVAAQEGRLPPILENKTYPRRTLELQELTAILAEQAADSTDSPEIGPPPVSQFVDEDPVKIDLPTKVRINENEELGGLDPVLSANLEQRKKRRDSTNISEAKKTIKNDPPNATTGSLKIGAKRKLSVRDDDENANAKKTQVSPDDSFSYTRLNGDVRTRLGPPSEKPVTKTTRDLAVARGAPRDKTASSNISTRRVLAPKSVNDSPRKSIKQQLVDEVKTAKADIAKSNPAVDRSHERREDSITVRPEIEPMPETVDIEPEPETPAGLDLFSPASSQPSTARPDSRDTPPPPELGQGQEGQRPSRRARGAVSYAEPNLRDKMRRPTKELVDAVAREAARQTASAKLEGVAGNVTIKAEPEADDAWKSLPVPSSVTVEASSPLSGKMSTSTATVLPSGLISHRKRRESSLPQDTEPVRTGSGGVISALLANTRRSKGENREKSPSDEAELAKAMSNLDVYDIRCSSPSLAQETVLKTETEVKPFPRQSRRQSSVSRDLTAGDEGEVSDIEAPKRQSSFASRRRTTTLGQRSLSVTREPAKVEEGEQASKRTNGTTSDDEVGVVGTRADRVTRRRSMMI